MEQYEVPNIDKLIKAVEQRLLEANTMLINITCFDKDDFRGAQCWKVVYKLADVQKMFSKLKVQYDPTRSGDTPIQHDSESPRTD